MPIIYTEKAIGSAMIAGVRFDNADFRLVMIGYGEGKIEGRLWGDCVL